MPEPVDESYGRARRLLYAFFSLILLAYRGDIECFEVNILIIQERLNRFG